MPRQVPRWSELRELIKFEPVEKSPARRRLRAALTVDDLREIARRRTPRAVFDYTDGGAGTEESVKRNRQSFARVEFSPRVLRDVSQVDTSTMILGQRHALPLILAPTGYTRMMHHHGELAVARAASRAGVPYALSTMGTTTPEDVAAAAPDARRWFQLYLWRDRDASRDFVRRAHVLGYDTLIITVDTPVGGSRLRDLRNGMTVPPTLKPKTILDGARHPHWWINFLTTEPLEFAALKSERGDPSALATRIFDPAATITEVQWLRELWQGNLVVKGIQNVDDARMVVDAGADGIVVSNHGGRQLDRGPVPLEQLPCIAEAVGDRAEIYVDGGVMSGADIVAAIALGARAVMIGRAYLYGLMAGGELGVDRVLTILRDEAHNVMQLLGTPTVGDITIARATLR